MTLWNMAVQALILEALGGVVWYKVQADRFAAADRLSQNDHCAACGPPEIRPAP